VSVGVAVGVSVGVAVAMTVGFGVLVAVGTVGTSYGPKSMMMLNTRGLLSKSVVLLLAALLPPSRIGELGLRR
jgi:hypothetical protein